MDFTPHFMSRSPLLRLGSALCATIVVSLFGVAAADAAPAHGRARTHNVCGTRPAPCRIKARLAKRSGKPLPYAVRVRHFGHRQAGSWLARSRPEPLRD